MFGRNKLGWLRNSILNEADKDNEAEDYQLDDTDSAEPTDEADTNQESETSTVDPEAEDTDGGDYQLDDADTTEPDDEGDTTSEEDGAEETPDTEGSDYQLDGDEGDDPTADTGNDTDGSDDITEDPEATEEEGSSNDNLKKLILLNQFREMVNLIDNLLLSATNLEKNNADLDGNDNIEYLADKLNDLKGKISFTIQKKFLTADYQELLKLFYYFKYGINDLTIFLEKIIKEETNK